MPQIPMISDRSRPGVLDLPRPLPQQFGAQAGQDLTQFGQALSDAHEKIQAQQDETALIEKTASYNERLAQIPGEILSDETIEPGQRYKQFMLKVQEHRRSLEAGASPAVVRALGNHEKHALSQSLIQFQAKDAEAQINTARVALMDSQAKSAEREAFALANGNDELAATERLTRHDALGRAVQRRMITPMEQRDAIARYDNDKFELLAQQNPEKMLRLTDAVRAGKSDVLGMDPTKATYYHNLAIARINERNKTLEDQSAKDKDEAMKAVSSGMWGQGMGVERGRDMSAQIEALRPMLTTKEYEKLSTDNFQVLNARKAITHEGQQRQSQFVQSDLLELAKRAKYEPELLAKQINNNVVRHHVFNRRDLHPDDASTIYTAISEAMAYHQTGDSVVRKAQTDAMKSLEVYVPQTAASTDATTLKNIQDSMQRQLRAELEAKPDAKPIEIHQLADTIRSQGEQRVLGAQKLTAQQVDEELFGMERHWSALDPGLVGHNHDLKPAARTKLEEQYPMLKGLFRLHDVRRERYEQLTKIGEAQAERAVKGKKK